MGVLFVNPPASASTNNDPAKIAHVPASDHPWIKLGADRDEAQRLAGATPEEEITSRSEAVQLASLGGSDGGSDIPAERSSLSRGAVRWGASPSCLDGRLREVIKQVASNFGPVRVNSTCRSHSHNAKVGGATHSKHLTGDAADFSVSRNKSAVLGWLRRHPSVGGLKLYAGGRGHFHIDTGPRRPW
jgi:hypothetical protein